jgi:chromosome transmission fidelity protein 4
VKDKLKEKLKPFQPNSIKVNLERTFLGIYVDLTKVYNMVGHILSINHGTHCTVDITFHDLNLRPFHFQDHNGYSMAALNERGAFFASKDVIFFKQLDSWASTTDWTLNLPENEAVECIALSKKWMAIATSRGYMRFFSYSGLQTFLFSLPSKIITMAAFEDNLFYICWNVDSFHLYLFNYKTNSIIESEFLPISPESELSWVGFSFYGLPSTYDSSGVLRVRLSKDQWIPLLDNSQKPDLYWALGIDQESFLCVECFVHFELIPRMGTPNYPIPKLSKCHSAFQYLVLILNGRNRKKSNCFFNIEFCKLERG